MSAQTPENKQCLGFFGWLFGHDYEPRYNITELESNLHHCPPNPAELGQLLGDSQDESETLDTVEKMHRNGNDTREKVYICDICARCGHVVKT